MTINWKARLAGLEPEVAGNLIVKYAIERRSKGLCTEREMALIITDGVIAYADLKGWKRTKSK